MGLTLAAGRSTLQISLQDGRRFVAHLPSSLHCARRLLRLSGSGRYYAKIRFGAIPRRGCRRGNRWRGKAGPGRGPPPSPTTAGAVRSRELTWSHLREEMLPCLSPSAAILAPPTVGRALQVAIRG